MAAGNQRKELWRLLLHLAGECQTLRQLKRIHPCVLRHQLFGPLILSKLLLFASVSTRGDVNYAALLFSYHFRDITEFSGGGSSFFYNTLMRGYANTSSPSISLSIFISMRRRSVPPDPFTFTFLLKALARSGASSSECDASVHAQAFKFGCLGSNGKHLHVHNALIHFYATRALPDVARHVLDEMPLKPDVVSWSGVLNAYLRAGDTDAARTVFDQMLPAERDVVTWTAMISGGNSGYTRAGRPRDALQLFDEMPVEPDEVTMLGLAAACAASGDLVAGERLHRYAEARDLIRTVTLHNALIDMYAKCGNLRRARQVFNEMNEEKRSLVTWNSMIWAHAAHGDADEAIALFRRISSGEVGLRADRVTNLAVLSACAHAGRVEECRKLLGEMTERSGELGAEHYGCVVDMLGRAGMLEEARQLVEGMPFGSNDKVWGALLGGCKIHGDAETGRMAGPKLVEMKPGEGGYCAMLSAIYVEAGRRADAAAIRRSLDRREASKTPGLSQLSSHFN